MIMGADVTHPGRCGDDGCPSMAGVVATCEANYMHYLPSARLQDSNTEVRHYNVSERASKILIFRIIVHC